MVMINSILRVARRVTLPLIALIRPVVRVDLIIPAVTKDLWGFSRGNGSWEMAIMHDARCVLQDAQLASCVLQTDRADCIVTSYGKNDAAGRLIDRFVIKKI